MTQFFGLIFSKKRLKDSIRAKHVPLRSCAHSRNIFIIGQVPLEMHYKRAKDLQAVQ
jgi:hypothetical protein